MLYTTPRVYVEDITVRTSLIGDMGIVKYIIQPTGLREGEIPVCRVTLHDAEHTLAIKEPVYGLSGTLKVPLARLWWPRGMDPKPGYLYSLEVERDIEFDIRLHDDCSHLDTSFKVKSIPNQLASREKKVRQRWHAV